MQKKKLAHSKYLKVSLFRVIYNYVCLMMVVCALILTVLHHQNCLFCHRETAIL